MQVGLKFEAFLKPASLVCEAHQYEAPNQQLDMTRVFVSYCPIRLQHGSFSLKIVCAAVAFAGRGKCPLHWLCSATVFIRILKQRKTTWFLSLTLVPRCAASLDCSVKVRCLPQFHCANSLQGNHAMNILNVMESDGSRSEKRRWKRGPVQQWTNARNFKKVTRMSPACHDEKKHLKVM